MPVAAQATESIAINPEDMPEALDRLQAQVVALHQSALLGTPAAMVAHEFNNLMTPVLLRAQDALDRDDPAAMRKACERAVVQTRKAIGICRHLMGVASSANDGAAETCRVADVLDEIGWDRGEVVRLMMLSTQYRKPLDWTAVGVREARERIDRWYRALDALGDVEPVTPEPDDPAIAAFFAAPEDDLNTPLAIAELHKAVDAVFAAQPDVDRGALRGRLELMAGFLGLLRNEPATWFKGAADDANVVDIEEKIAAREAARRAKDFAKADQIREELENQGIVLEDGPGGTTWRRAG